MLSPLKRLSDVRDLAVQRKGTGEDVVEFMLHNRLSLLYVTAWQIECDCVHCFTTPPSLQIGCVTLDAIY